MIASVLLIIAALLFIVTFGIHATIMSGDPMERPAYTTHPVLQYIPAICAFVLPVIAWSIIIDIQWIWLFILNIFFGFLVSRWLTAGFLTRFASGNGLGKDMLVAFGAAVAAFIVGISIHTNRAKVYDSTYHTNSNYKYEHRTGTTGDYTYNYDVSGTDENGNNVSGNVDMQGKYGTGTLTDEEGNEIEVEVEWIGSGQLSATDDDGNTYDLEVD